MQMPSMPDDTSSCERCCAVFSAHSARRLCEKCSEAPSHSVIPSNGNGGREDSPDAVPTLSKHRILEQIAQGGMSAVHRGRQDSLQRDVAVKVVDSDQHGESVDRLAREARVLALLDHPNIVPIYDYGTDSAGRRAYTMKLVRGQTLGTILTNLRKGTEKGTLQRLLRIFRKVCDAVGFAHSRGIIHRDLKPENIMVGEFGEVLVMDWGVAADLSEMNDNWARPRDLVRFQTPPAGDEAIESSSLTIFGEVLGTPEYMSPEQACGTIRVDGRADIYALGGILYAILTLRAPITRSSCHETLEDVRRGRIEPFEPIDSIAPERTGLWRIPPALLAVVRKAMASDRENRFATVDELAADVDAYIGGFATTAEKINIAGQLWLLLKRHRAFSTASVLLLVVTFIFVVRLVASEGRANDSEKTARTNEAAARVAERLARQNEESARAALARARTLQADSAYAANDARQMREGLDAVPKDLRDAHWQYLNERTDERQALLNWEGNGFLVGSTPHPEKPGVFTVATNGDTHRIVDFDAKTGEVLKSFSYGEGWVRAIAYSPDKKKIAVGRIMSGGISIHDAEDGSEVQRWETDWVAGMQFLPDGSTLLQSRTIGCTLWDVATGKSLWESPYGKFHFLLPGAQRFVSITENHIRIHSIEDGSVICMYPVRRAVPQTASLSPNGEIFVVAQEDGQITGFRLEDGSTAFETTSGEDGDIRRTAFTPDGQRIVTVAALEESGQAIRILDATTGRLLRKLRGGAGGVESMTIHPLSNELLITCENSATWALPRNRQPSWSLEPGILAGFFGGNDHVLALHGSKGFAALAVADGVEIWRPSQNTHYAAATDFAGSTGVAQTVGGAGDGRDFVAFRAGHGSINETATFRFETDARVIAINCDGTRAAIGSAWALIAAYRTETGAAFPKIDSASFAFTHGLAWHGKDPQKLVGIFARYGRRGNPKSEEWIVAWNTSTGQRIAQARHASSLNCLATEPRGNRLAEGGDDKFIRIRDAESLAVLREFRAHDYPIHTVAWNPVFPILATSATDRAIRLWNVETGRMIEEVHIGQREATALRFSPDGRRLAASSPGARTLIWEISNLEAGFVSTRKAPAR
jgi:serine/threonine protein kinase/WD40 repeat protein